jgi:hypothetical protein
MSRRSRSQRPQKARNSEPPVAGVPAVPKAAETADGASEEPTASSLTDELAAVDAGWDKLFS